MGDPQADLHGRRAERLTAMSRRAALSGAFALAAGGAIASLCPARLAAEAELPFVEAAPGVFVRHGLQQEITAENGGAIANIGFVVGDASVAVIDTGTTTRQGAALKAAIRAVTSRPVSHLVATHVHLDHCFGHGAFADEIASGALVNIGHSRLPRALAERGPYYRDQIRALAPAFADTDFIAPAVTVEETLDIDLGNRTLTLTAWPAAHTDSDLTVLDHRTKTLWAADLLFDGRIPTLDGNLNGWLAALERLIPADAALVVPGHGPVSDGRAALQRERAYLATLRDGVRAALNEGLDLTAAVESLKDAGREDWLLFDAFHGRNTVTAYTQLEWE